MTDRKPVRNVEFYSKNKFEKLVHLVSFILRIYHDDARFSNAVLCPIFLNTYRNVSGVS
jgi:hypothetical protein